MKATTAATRSASGRGRRGRSSAGTTGSARNPTGAPNSSGAHRTAEAARGTTNNGEAELRISADGTATARSFSTNQTFAGTYSNGVLRFDWGSFNLIRDGDNIRTVEINNRDNQTTYRRTSGF